MIEIVHAIDDPKPLIACLPNLPECQMQCRITLVGLYYGRGTQGILNPFHRQLAMNQHLFRMGGQPGASDGVHDALFTPTVMPLEVACAFSKSAKALAYSTGMTFTNLGR